MKYIIPTIENSNRQEYVDDIRNLLSTRWEESTIPLTVNGSSDKELSMALSGHGDPDIRCNITVGETGRWMTFMNHLKLSESLDEPLFAIEDDAVVCPYFFSRVDLMLEYHLPRDADFFSLFVPKTRRREVYLADLSVKPEYYIGSEVVVRAHQEFGGVAMFIFPQFYQKMRKLIKRDGIVAQFDDTIYSYSQAGEVNGYTLAPVVEELVDIVAGIPSTVHDTPIYERGK